MFNKEFGLGQKIIKHKNKLGNIKTAFLTKTYIQNKRKNDNDIDLVLVGNSINYIYLDKLIKEFEDANERSINYTYLTQTEFEEYKRSNNYFLSNVIFKEKIVLIGEESLIYT